MAHTDSMHQKCGMRSHSIGIALQANFLQISCIQGLHILIGP